LALWQRIAKPRAVKSIDKANLHVRRFVELVGDRLPRDVVRKHAIEYRDALGKLPGLSATSVDKHLYGMHRLFSVALSEGVVDSNPFSGVKARKADNGKFADQGKKPFTSEQSRLVLTRLNGLPKLPIDDRIVMRLLAYHGMRGAEACQLRASDVKRVNGIDVISINDAAGSIKNRASLRDIPLHPKCRDLVKRAKSKAPDAYLFDYPMWKHSRAGKFQQRANAWLRQIGITDKNVTVHSWRHTWRTLARECDMPEPVSRAILGHTLGSGEHGKYGEGPSLKVRAKWMAKVDPLKG
jgi:integrase